MHALCRIDPPSPTPSPPFVSEIHPQYLAFDEVAGTDFEVPNWSVYFASGVNGCCSGCLPRVESHPNSNPIPFPQHIHTGGPIRHHFPGGVGSPIVGLRCAHAPVRTGSLAIT